jgi:hypothetical protein
MDPCLMIEVTRATWSKVTSAGRNAPPPVDFVQRANFFHPGQLFARMCLNGGFTAKRATSFSEKGCLSDGF